jgi:tungstate transport system substrate-binding protein
MLLRLLLVLLLAWPLPLLAQASPLRLGTTSSVDNSRLLAVLLPAFERSHPYRVDVIAVGSGKALRLAADGDIDVLLAHDPLAEQAFMDAGYGIERRPVMSNDYVFVGPRDDPADIAASVDVPELLARIHRVRARFISRGDHSGTHQQELRLWASAGLRPEQGQYLQAGQSMGSVLRMAYELDGYTLSDRGTWLAYRAQLPGLNLLWEGDASLENLYSIILISPQRHPRLNHRGARDFANWLVSTEAQELIRGFRIDGEMLFHPTAAAP